MRWLAVLVVLAGVWYWGYRVGHVGYDVLRASVDAERVAREQTAQIAMGQRRADDAREAAARQEINRETQILADRSRRDALGAAVAGGGLLERFTRAVRTSCPAAPDRPAIASSGPPAPDPRTVLIDVLSRVVVTAGELAVIADQRGAAGRACERSYDALTPGVTP